MRRAFHHPLRAWFGFVWCAAVSPRADDVEFFDAPVGPDWVGPVTTEIDDDAFQDAAEAPEAAVVGGSGWLGGALPAWETVAGAPAGNWETATMVDELLLEEAEEALDGDRDGTASTWTGGDGAASEAPSAAWSKRTGASGRFGDGPRPVDPEVVDAMMEAVVENRRLLVRGAVLYLCVCVCVCVLQVMVPRCPRCPRPSGPSPGLPKRSRPGQGPCGWVAWRVRIRASLFARPTARGGGYGICRTMPSPRSCSGCPRAVAPSRRCRGRG
jgi:hypothetical protein